MKEASGFTEGEAVDNVPLSQDGVCEGSESENSVSDQVDLYPVLGMKILPYGHE
jgi:hypothetical protein